MNLFRRFKLAFTSSTVKHLKPLVISAMTLWNLWTEPQHFQTVVLLLTQLHFYAIIFYFQIVHGLHSGIKVKPFVD